ncbi:hypothetical protein [Ramlibacter sp. 2FC]|uniref:hypothetical protein n=1 Tax=Ramlibacter sp. 2FC TaxID=2502188 RepID=UPI0010F52752|nr:hypothetical protein [Ramlibacter sp. 2FC]
MAKIRIEGVLEHLRYDMRRALQAALEEVAPQANIDPNELFRVFKRQVGRKCNYWQQVPDQLVED